MEKISYKLEVFEGPMDLLLHLITKHKLDIYDIPILELVEQYTSYVREMQEENMEVASEFLEMAARLVYIKTVSLLPVYDEAEELKNELRDELLEYRDCKILAGKLSQMTDGFNYTVRAFPEEVAPDMSYKRLHEPSELLGAYSLAAGKKLRRLPPPLDSFKTIVTKKIVSVGSKIESIVTSLKSKRKRKLYDIYREAKSRSDLIVAFLAVLELAKNKTIYVSGDGDDIQIELLEGMESVD
ncbi:MAG: segregation/condensation protein A [Clostridia bacterium]|nr:segregation/condensation protein A [Clostridia bacterium]MBP3559069.1 segregation/condensation protein A [Clostridia bacterium]